MLTKQDRVEVNKFLMSQGLGNLEDRTIFLQLAQFIRNEEHFGKCLMRCDPEKRHLMYESLRPHLSFTPKPLDVIEAEAKMDAERKQLPVIDDKGNVTDFRTYHAGQRLNELAENAISKGILESEAKGFLELKCSRCTVEDVIPAPKRQQSVIMAAQKGWTFEKQGEEEVSICPKCSKERVH